MKRFAKSVNFFFYSIIVSDDPNCLILLTKFAGRRTIANLPAGWQGRFDASHKLTPTSTSPLLTDGTKLANSWYARAPFLCITA